MKMLYRSSLTVLLALISVTTMFAQWNVDIEDVDADNFPTVNLQVAVRQAGVLRRDIDSSMFLIRENGVQRMPSRVHCPGATRGFSLVFVIGVGSLTSINEVNVASGIAQSMVDRMNGLIDEAAIVTYDNTAMARQEFTNVKPMLIGTLQSLAPTAGGNHIWDGAHYGVNMALYGTHPDRAVLFLSNGKGDGGSKDLPDVITHAQLGNIKVHCFGINAVGNDQLMRELAQQTGGEYFTSIDRAVQKIIDDLSGTPEYCNLEYESADLCLDGVDRDVFLRFLRNNDSVTTSTRLSLAADPASSVAVTLRLDTASITSSNSKKVALELTPAVQGQPLSSGIMEFEFDTALVHLSSVVTTATMAEGLSGSVENTGDGARVILDGFVVLNGNGTLMHLEFTAKEVQQNTTVPVELTSTQFDRGCLDIDYVAGEITVLPKSASLSLSSQPIVFNWDDANGRYTPDPATLIVEVTNNGDLTIGNLSAEFALSDDVRVADGESRIVPVVPDELAPGAKGVATWLVQAMPQRSEKTAQIEVHVTGDLTSRKQTVYLNIKAAGSAVRTRTRVDEIRTTGGVYAPSPATVTAAVHSSGAQAGPEGSVSVILPGELSLAAGNDTQMFISMASGDSTILQWEVFYPTDGSAATYDIGIVTSVIGRADETHTVTLVVPELGVTQIDIDCEVTPTRYTWDGSAILFTAIVSNNGTVESTELTGRLTVPVDLAIVGSETQQLDALLPGSSDTLVWILQAGIQCDELSLPLELSIESNTSTVGTCTSSITIESSNELPEIVSVQPAAIDTVALNDAVTFLVDAVDPDDDELEYIWSINGVVEQISAENQFVWVFDAVGDYDVLCAIVDACDTVYVSWEFAVAVPLSASWIINPERVAIVGNYPNPFNPSTVIEFTLPDGRWTVHLDVLDIVGRVRRTLVSGQLEGGTHRVGFDADDLPAGAYIARLRSGDVLRVHLMTLVK